MADKEEDKEEDKEKEGICHVDPPKMVLSRLWCDFEKGGLHMPR